MRAILRFLLAACILAGCTNDLDLGDQPDSDGTDGHDCPDHSDALTLVAPAADATTIHLGDPIILQWNEIIPDRYTSMSGGGNFVIPEEQNSGSQTKQFYELLAGMTYEFEAGWICDAGSGGPENPLVQLTLLAVR